MYMYSPRHHISNMHVLVRPDMAVTLTADEGVPVGDSEALLPIYLGSDGVPLRG